MNEEKKITPLGEIFKTAASTKQTRLWTIGLIVVIAAAVWFLRDVIRPQIKKEDLTDCKGEIALCKTELRDRNEKYDDIVDQIIKINREVKELVPEQASVSFVQQSSFVFASYDTTKKPLTKDQYQQKVRVISSKLDSLIKKIDTVKTKT